MGRLGPAGRYEQAYEETLHFKRPLLFWDPLLKAATLGLLGKTEDGVLTGKVSPAMQTRLSNTRPRVD
jgi:hypothetical protein